jgi:hypothetical protein
MKRYFYIGAIFLLFNNGLLFGQGDVIISAGGNPITVNSGATVTPDPTISPIGFGSYSPSITSIGSINVSGLLGVQMDDATGSAGSDPGWMLLSMTTDSGQVSFSGGIALLSFNPSGSADPIPDFNSSASYQWQIINALNNNLNINGNLTVDLSQFYNSYSGVFSTYATSSGLFLTYNPIPEPSAASLLAIFTSSFLLLKHRLFHG